MLLAANITESNLKKSSKCWLWCRLTKVVPCVGKIDGDRRQTSTMKMARSKVINIVTAQPLQRKHSILCNSVPSYFTRLPVVWARSCLCIYDGIIWSQPSSSSPLFWDHKHMCVKVQWPKTALFQTQPTHTVEHTCVLQVVCIISKDHENPEIIFSP